MSQANGRRQLYISLESPATGARLAPAELLPKIVKDARKEGSTITDVATRIISERLGLPFEASGRTSSPRTDSRAISPLVSQVVWRALGSFGEGSRQDAARLILCEHYRLKPVTRIAKQTRSAA